MVLILSSYECKAFLGSPEVFNHAKYVVRYVIMEWTFSQINLNDKKIDYGNPCPDNKVQEMADMLDGNSYLPYFQDGRPADFRKSLSWKGNMVWIHKDSRPVFQRRG